MNGAQNVARYGIGYQTKEGAMNSEDYAKIPQAVRDAYERELAEREAVRAAVQLRGSAARALEVVGRLTKKLREEERKRKWWQFWK
jgi:hypothetical protein